MPQPIDKQAAIRQRVQLDLQQRECVKTAQTLLGVLVDGHFGPQSLAALVEIVDRLRLLENPDAGTLEGPKKEAE